MSNNLVIKSKVATLLLSVLQTNNAQAQAIMAFFAPYCDCDIRTWIVSRVQANDQIVIDKIKELITGTDDYPITRGTSFPVLGQLLAQYCNGNDFVGIYADGNGGQLQKTIEFDSSSHGCVPEGRANSVKFYFPLPDQRTALDAGSTNVQFSDIPHIPYYDYDSETRFLLSVNIYLNAPKIARLQVKVGDLLGDDYSDVQCLLGTSRSDTDSYYTFEPDVTPYNTTKEDWYHGNISISFNPASRIISISKPYTTSNRNILPSYLDIVLKKGQYVLGALTLAFACEPYDPNSPAAQNRYDLMAFTYGSNR